MSSFRPARTRALTAAALTATLTGAAVGVVPGVANAATRSVTVKLFASNGTTLLHSYTTTVNTDDFHRFAVATQGHNDAGSGEGQVAIDDLAVTDNAGATTTWTFATPPTINESTTGGTNDALRHDLANGRLLGIGNSAYTCSTNYETVDVGVNVTKARFTIRRVTADTGDGSFWNVMAGVVPGDSEPIVGATCTGGSVTGTPDNFVGIVYEGDGDGVRNRISGFADGGAATSVYNGAINTVYVVEIETGTAVPNRAPSTPAHISPITNAVFRVGATQTFTIRSTDPDGNPYTGQIDIKDASGGVVRTLTTPRVASGATASVTVSPALSQGSYTWSAFAYDDFGGTSGASAPTAFRVNAAPSVPAQIAPTVGATFASDASQVFSASATDPNSDNVRVQFTVRNALGGVVTTFSSAFGPSGATLSGSPGSPLPAGTYTWSAQAFDIWNDGGPVSAERPFTVTLASEECGPGSTVVNDGYVNGTYVRLRYRKVDADTYWVCWRVDNSGSVRNGGRFVVDEAAVTGTPSTSADADYCSTTSGNLLPPASVIRGTIGDPADPTFFSYGADGYVSAGKAAICLQAGDVDGRFFGYRVLIPVPALTTPGARIVQDSAGTYRPSPVDQPAYPSGDCQVPGATELVNSTVTTGNVWLATWQESATRAHVCVRAAGGVNRGGRLTIDTSGTGINPVVNTGSDSSICDRSVAAVTSGPAPFAIERSAATNPSSVCVTIGATTVAVRLGASATFVQPTVTWTADSGGLV